MEHLHGKLSLYPGLIDCSVCQNASTPARFIVLERWESWEDLYRYVRSDDYRKILSIMELSAMDPEIQFNEIKKTRGMDFQGVEKIGHFPDHKWKRAAKR